MQTKAMRSASSEDIRSEARREIRTREGKNCHVDIMPLSALVRHGSAPKSADLGSLVQVGTLLRECFRRPDYGNAILP